MESPLVLVACPTYEGCGYCLDKFAERIKELTYPNYNILIVDNSEGDEYYNKIKEKGIQVIKGPRFNEPVRTITNSRNLIIDFAIRNGYDYLLNMDQDVIPPKNIIEELMGRDKDIVSGVYYGYFRSGGKLKYLPIAYRCLTKEEFEEIQNDLPPFIKSCEDIKRNLTEDEVNSGEVLEVKIPCNGCMLVKRKVFEKVNYDLLDMPEISKTSDDIHFCENAKQKGFKLYVYTKIKCDHLVNKNAGYSPI